MANPPIQAVGGTLAGMYGGAMLKDQMMTNEVNRANTIVDVYNKALDYEMKDYGFNVGKEAGTYKSEAEAKSAEGRRRAYVAAKETSEDEMARLEALRQRAQDDPASFETDVIPNLPDNYKWVKTPEDFDRAMDSVIKEKNTRRQMAMADLTHENTLDALSKKHEYNQELARIKAESEMDQLYARFDLTGKLNDEQQQWLLERATDVWADAYNRFPRERDEAGNDVNFEARRGYALAQNEKLMEIAALKAASGAGESTLDLAKAGMTMTAQATKETESWAKNEMRLSKDKRFNKKAVGYDDVEEYVVGNISNNVRLAPRVAAHARELFMWDGDQFVRLPQLDNGAIVRGSSEVKAMMQRHNIKDAKKAIEIIMNSGVGSVRDKRFDAMFWEAQGE